MSPHCPRGGDTRGGAVRSGIDTSTKLTLRCRAGNADRLCTHRDSNTAYVGKPRQSGRRIFAPGMRVDRSRSIQIIKGQGGIAAYVVEGRVNQVQGMSQDIHVMLLDDPGPHRNEASGPHQCWLR